jgi:hypothetical protein
MTMNNLLRAFVETHPEGWNHADWLGLLAELKREGTDVSDLTAVGKQLERTRLAWELERRSVPGLGPKRRAAIADRFESLWALRHTSPEDLAKVPSVPLSLAEKVLRAIH